jgi:hydroxymethylbilane synthase
MTAWNRFLCLFSLVLSLQSSTTDGKSIRIGSRPSPLALVQANLVAKAISESNPSIATPTIVEISASGDSKGGVQDVPLAVLSVDFTGALDEALQSGQIDLAVHSLKDISPTNRWNYRDEFFIACPLCREDPADVLLGPYESLQSIPSGSKIGTSSIRRQAELRSILCDDAVEVVNVRGNLDSRCKALEDGTVDALILANAGLNRLKNDDSIVPYKTRIPTNVMLPAACQGIVAAVYLQNNPWNFEEWLHEDHDAAVAASAERAFLDSLDASSPWVGRPPLAGLMERSITRKDDDDDNQEHPWTFRGLLARPDGSRVLKTSAVLPGDCSKSDAEALGKKLGLELLAEAGPHFYD